MMVGNRLFTPVIAIRSFLEGLDNIRLKPYQDVGLGFLDKSRNQFWHHNRSLLNGYCDCRA